MNKLIIFTFLLSSTTFAAESVKLEGRVVRKLMKAFVENNASTIDAMGGIYSYQGKIECFRDRYNSHNQACWVKIESEENKVN